jgi:hypothetical protein
VQPAAEEEEQQAALCHSLRRRRPEPASCALSTFSSPDLKVRFARPSSGCGGEERTGEVFVRQTASVGWLAAAERKKGRKAAGGQGRVPLPCCKLCRKLFFSQTWSMPPLKLSRRLVICIDLRPHVLCTL